MKVQVWIVSVRYCSEDCPVGPLGLPRRHAVVGPARASTVEAALHLAAVPEEVRAEIRADQTVRNFVDGRLDPAHHGYYITSPCGASSWLICIGSIQEVLS
jgi:hypothetical protein